MKYAWVIDVDIKGFFDNISHGIMLGLLGMHTKEKWVLMYVERWLKAGVEQEDGSIAARQKGTPQGGVISPLLANLYLHHAFDKWMDASNPQCPFERYADDIVIHCSSREEAEKVLKQLEGRMQEYMLTLHPEKTKIVYCKDYKRNGGYANESFTFLSYTFQPRTVQTKAGRLLVMFLPAISNAAKSSIRAAIKEILVKQRSTQTLQGSAARLNPKIRGWVNYYGKYARHKALNVFCYLNDLIRGWIKNTYKLYRKNKVYKKYRAIQEAEPALFYHWQLGLKA